MVLVEYNGYGGPNTFHSYNRLPNPNLVEMTILFFFKGCIDIFHFLLE